MKRPSNYVLINEMWIDLNASPQDEVLRIKTAFQKTAYESDIGFWNAWLLRQMMALRV